MYKFRIAYKNYKLHFVRSGNIYVYYGYLRSVGVYGDYWSRSGSAAARAYDFAFLASGVYPSNGPYDRYHGFSLRCLQE